MPYLLSKAGLLFFSSKLCLSNISLHFLAHSHPSVASLEFTEPEYTGKTHRSKTQFIFLRVIHAILSTALASHDAEEENPLRKHNLYEPICLSPLPT